MAQIDDTILGAALNAGWFQRPLDEDARSYLRPSVVTAHDIVTLIKASIEGLSVEQLAERSGVSSHTCKQFCRWLASNGLIVIDSEPVDPNRGIPAQRNIYRHRE